MIKLNKVGMLIIGLFILITGCDNDPLELTPLEGESLVRTVFTLIEDSKSVQDSVLIGSSKTLYSGYVEDDKLSTILLSLDYDNFQEHPICLYGNDSLNNIENIQFEFRSLQTIMDLDSNLFVDTTALTIGLSMTNSWSEDSDLVNFPEFSDDASIIIIDSFKITENSLQITIVDSLQLLEWCNSQSQYLIIKYEPELNTLPEDILKLLEFYSAEFTISYRPEISFDYNLLQATNKSSNKFLIDGIEISSDLSESSVHVVSDSTSQSWSRIYLLNVEPTDNFSPLEDVLLNESIVIYELDFNDEPVITSEMLEVETEILTLTIQLNEEIIDSIDTFGLSILDNSIIAYSISSDLSGDNYDEDTNPEGTENNMVFDEGENFLDFGIDKCPDQFEDGNDSCLVLLTDFDSTEFNCIASDDIEVDMNCIYNTLGTEGNGVLDWEDLADEDGNFNGIWDNGEGEKWEDVGSEGCTDEFEDGEGACLETQNTEFIEGSDPNGDNYNIDPAGDDFDEDANSGTENNENWEEGELFFDIGCDGIPQIVDDDGTQGNEFHDDCEPFNDTGIDGLYSSQEEGYNYSGTEGNAIYNSGESTDAGDEDGCLNQFEDGEGGCLYEINLNYIEGSDPNGDDYIIDPNGDNEDGDGNGVIDWTDTNDDDLYNKDNEIGEYFYDFGTDGVVDTDEAFSEVNFLNILTGYDQEPGDLGPYNNHTITKDSEEIIFPPQPELETSDAVLWISKITPLENNQFELKFSIFAVKEIKSLSFSLTHDPLDWIDTTFVSQSFSSNDYTAKFVDDISVYKINDLEDETQLTLNYSHGITSNMDFVNIDSSRTPIEISLSDFIDENINVLLSNEYTQLILPIDTDNSIIDEYGANLVLSGIINEETQPLITINISQNDEHIIIPMSTLLQKYINGQYINYDGFELSLDGSKYNFSNIILLNNAYLEIVHSQ